MRLKKVATSCRNLSMKKFNLFLYISSVYCVVCSVVDFVIDFDLRSACIFKHWTNLPGCYCATANKMWIHRHFIFVCSVHDTNINIYCIGNLFSSWWCCTACIALNKYIVIFIIYFHILIHIDAFQYDFIHIAPTICKNLICLEKHLKGCCEVKWNHSTLHTKAIANANDKR